MAEPESAPTPLAGRIKDARGRRVTQLDPVAIHLLRRPDIIDADTLRAIAHQKGVTISRGERLSLIGACVAVVLVVGLIIQSLIAGDFGSAPLARSSSLLMFCGFVWLYWVRAKWARFDHIAAAMLRHGRCPHCGYDLRFLPADAQDGATVCPECGCAWMFSEARAPQGDGNG